MRNKISAIIIDREYKYRDYSGIFFNTYDNNAETRFQLKILENGENILHEIYDFNGVDAIITIGDKLDWKYLGALPFEYRKKWTHIDEYNSGAIVSNIISTFLYNIERKDDAPLKFSFFTCTYKTGKDNINRLYNSLISQTYKEWDWFVLDDSPDDETVDYIESLKDPRITVFRNSTRHGSIGFNKHMIAMACDGDFLIELDHDDEVTSDCLETLLNAYVEYPESDFFYSNCVELKVPSMTPIIYGKGWGWGEGLTKTEVVNGVKYTFSESPGINPYSIRTIYAQPNHLRCWRKSFYHMIGGHNTDLSVLDDQELIIRTFLSGKMTKIDKVLYIQYEGDGERGKADDNTQSTRFAEIQRTTFLIKNRFDAEIHKRIIDLGYVDDAWDDNLGYSILDKKHEPGQNMMNNFYTPKI